MTIVFNIIFYCIHRIINKLYHNQNLNSMKKSILLTLSILFCLSLNSQRNANAEYWVSFTYLPKKGMVGRTALPPAHGCSTSLE